jgi:hypothetical protein
VAPLKQRSLLFTNSERICTECIAWLRQLHFAANKFMKARFFSRCSHSNFVVPRAPPSEIILSTYTCAAKEPLSVYVWPGLTLLSLEYQFVGCATVEPVHFNPS